MEFNSLSFNTVLKEKNIYCYWHARLNTGLHTYIQVVCNALWMVTSHHETIRLASQREGGKPIPPPFNAEVFKNRNDFKKKKIKKANLSGSELNSHAQALYSLLLKPVMKSTQGWCRVHDEIQALADSFTSYCECLYIKLDNVTRNQNRDSPVRTVGEHATVEFRLANKEVSPRYERLNQDLSVLKEGDHLFFYENTFS